MGATVTLLMGATAARVVSVVALPLLSRLYSPEDFGTLAIFTAILATAAPFVTLRYAQAIPILRTKTSVLNVTVISLFCLLLTSAIFAVFCFSSAIFEWNVRGISISFFVAGLLVVGYLLSGGYELLSNLAIRQRFYGILSKVSIRQAIVTATVKIVGGLASFRPEGLLLGHVLGLSSGLVSLSPSLGRGLTSATARPARVLRLARALVQFPLFRLPSQFLLASAAQLPILYVAGAYDIATAGQFGVAMVLLNSTISMAAVSLGQAFFGEISSTFREAPGKVAGITLRVQLRLLLVGVVISTVVFFAAPPAATFFLGREWSLAGQVVAYMAPCLLFQFAATPVIRVMDLLRAQWLFLAINTVRFSAVVAVATFSTKTGANMIDFVVYYSATMSLFYIFTSVVVFSSLRFSSVRNRGVS